MVFKCKNCGGNVIYSPERQDMFCPFCESEKSEERVDSSQNDIRICPNCGGEVTLTEHTSATQCPYCENYLILDERVEGDYQPNLIVPFYIGKENCKKEIRERFKKNLFAPTDFLSEVRLNGMQGSYVPFWLYDYNVHCEYRGEGTKVHTRTVGDTQYTETSYFDIYRNADAEFKRIPVDASIEMPDEIMDLLEPYNYKQLTEFEPKYMSGFFGEKYNMESDLVESRAREKMRQDMEQMVQESIGGYGKVTTQKKDIDITNQEANYGLLPVWKYIYSYNGQTYPFYVNGQTGKIVGTAPLSYKKMAVYAGTLWVCLTGAMALAVSIISML